MIATNNNLAGKKPAGKRSTREAARGQNLLPQQSARYVPDVLDDPDHPRPVDREDREFEGTEEADDRKTYEAEERQMMEQSGSAPGLLDSSKVTVPRLMHDLRVRGGVWVPKYVRMITDNGDQAIVLAQVLYWFDLGRNGKPRAGIWRNGRCWFYKTHKEFAKETGLTPRRVKACLHALQDKGLIVIDHFLAEGHRTTFISLNVAQVLDAMREALERR